MNTTEELVLSVRELSAGDIPLLTDYWLNSNPGFLSGMGVDLSKMPSRSDWHSMLEEQLHQSYAEKKSYCLIWLVNGEPVGHSNVNKIIFGQEAYMHLHLWTPDARQKGHGLNFVKMGIPLFFKNLELKTLYCEPYALNPAPNRILEKAGFQFLRTYTTIPGWLNFEQPVKLWSLSREEFESRK
ncbi:MAG: GNAT family N-acetyltransferase [Chitinophagaceae bacterium]|nr:GNAT family N-acetyltransferase [Chitinophagaceae bacterium]